MSFPICNKGSCKRNKKGIMSAYIRAKQWGKPRSFYKNYWGKPHMKRKVYTRVAKKARKLMGWKKGGGRSKRRRRRKTRRKTRKKRGGGWRQVWPGGGHDTIEEAVARLNNLPKDTEIRISLPEEDWNEENRRINADLSSTDPLKEPLEFSAGGEHPRARHVFPVEQQHHLHHRLHRLRRLRHTIFLAGVDVSQGGALVDYPFKIEVWEQKKPPKSARKTSKRKKKSRTTASLPDWPITMV